MDNGVDNEGDGVTDDGGKNSDGATDDDVEEDGDSDGATDDNGDWATGDDNDDDDDGDDSNSAATDDDDVDDDSDDVNDFNKDTCRRASARGLMVATRGRQRKRRRSQILWRYTQQSNRSRGGGVVDGDNYDDDYNEDKASGSVHDNDYDDGRRRRRGWRLRWAGWPPDEEGGTTRYRNNTQQ